MKKIGLLLVILLISIGVFAQKDEKTKNEKQSVEPIELAKKAFAAHGGEKFKNMKTLIVRGSGDVSGSPTQTFPSTFETIFSGDKYRFELNSVQSFKQVYDGQQTFSSVPNFTLPPINRLGLPLLQKMDDKDYKVSELPEKNKKKTGFRITSPEGYYTDFFLDEKTLEVKGYESSYDFNGRNVTTAVDIDKLKEVEGVKIPEKYAQRFELGFTIYSTFKAKEILVNSPVADDVFKL
jgi:hypothetical protein